jgi:hypothetical protein
MRFTCLITKATNTQSEYVILIAFCSNNICTNASHCYVIVLCLSCWYWLLVTRSCFMWDNVCTEVRILIICGLLITIQSCAGTSRLQQLQVQIIIFFKRAPNFFLRSMTAHRDEGLGRILLGDKHRRRGGHAAADHGTICIRNSGSRKTLLAPNVSERNYCVGRGVSHSVELTWR